MPEVGMKIKYLHAFFFNQINIIKQPIDCKIEKIRKLGLRGFKYKIKGYVLDKNESLIQVYGFIISLEKNFPDGLYGYENNEYIEIDIDRLDAEIALS